MLYFNFFVYNTSCLIANPLILNYSKLYSNFDYLKLFSYLFGNLSLFLLLLLLLICNTIIQTFLALYRSYLQIFFTCSLFIGIKKIEISFSHSNIIYIWINRCLPVLHISYVYFYDFEENKFDWKNIKKIVLLSFSLHLFYLLIEWGIWNMTFIFLTLF